MKIIELILNEEDEKSGMSKHDRALWKKDWKPEMDLPSKRVCGRCKTTCVIVTDCPSCARFKMNPCNEWCPKCEEHPSVISVEKIIDG